MSPRAFPSFPSATWEREVTRFLIVALAFASLSSFPSSLSARESSERPAIHRYSLDAPTITRLLEIAHIASNSDTKVDMRPFFESAGATFGFGCFATLRPSAGMLTIKCTNDNQELIELICKEILGTEIQEVLRTRIQ